ncbi:methyltransferase [Thalassotalea euphylliae]|uniref:Methyltransferase n=1 Tax=Thalassotalea euphylliae TaxID=1655234 RepID=A0A3E0TWK2_9GAMM|nr:class I SAM-dependent methyltransferase [Thalassotalea euphylliae]REL29016.1 methyltransferase [Thalassotalea euphylliae]
MSISISTLIDHIQLQDDANTQRLFHGRGHAYEGLEHICVDWFAPVVLVTLYREVEHDSLLALAHSLNEKVGACQSVLVQHRWQPMAPIECLVGEDIRQLHALESGLKYQIEFGRAQNHGLFLDMKNGRDWVQANAKDKNVLNLFSYTCAFSVAASHGGAKQVVNIDMSKPSLARGRDNHRLNDQSTEHIVFQAVDIFKSFGRLKKFGPYQMIIVDPPSFQKGSVNIARDYGKIIRRIPQLASPNADVMLCLNSPDLDEAFLLNTVAQECPELEFVDKLAPPAVFKEAHAGKGLKVMLFRYAP